MMRLGWLGLLALVLSGCAHHHRTSSVQITTLLHDDAYTGINQDPLETEQQVFALPSAAKVFLDKLIAEGKLDRQDPRAIADVIFSSKQLNLLYDNDANTTAGQTFQNRQANCLSMTILAYAMARYVGLKASFQQVAIPEYWVQRQGFSLLNGHINLKLMPSDYQPTSLSFVTQTVEVDFNGGSGTDHFARSVINKTRVLAMFYNNKGADAMLDGQYRLAYRYFTAALARDNKFIPAMGNLGALYRQTGHPDWALALYNHALNWQPDNLTILESLAVLEQSQGQTAQADKIFNMLKRRRENNPYYHFMLGEQAYYNQQWRAAIADYQQAVRLDNKVHEFYFGLAKAYYQLNELSLTQHYLRLAKRYAPLDQEQQRYQGKLELLSGL